MEQIPIHDGEPLDNVVHLPGGHEPDDELDDEPETRDGDRSRDRRGAGDRVPAR